MIYVFNCGYYYYVELSQIFVAAILFSIVAHFNNKNFQVFLKAMVEAFVLSVVFT